eukprot:gene43724-54330_t
MVNSFHQFRLGPKTAARLSIVTPWGQFQPRFMPEGVGPASHILQSTVTAIFADFEDWTIVLFDNFLILAHDYDDAYSKLVIFLNRCVERNIFLKFSKSYLGVTRVNFFGYVCEHNSYWLSEERTQCILDIPFPTSQKGVQSFLGMALFFKDFVANYSTLAARLNDMAHKDFNWNDRSTWHHDYQQHFLDFKVAISNSAKLFYPDYSLEWVMSTDASDVGTGAVLFQRRLVPVPQNEPILFMSEKFSEQALRWKTLEKECYAIYSSVLKSDFWLRCKQFILETDHRNLLWMASSQVPKIQRWHAYLI